MELSEALLKIREAQTDGINCDVTTEDIIAKLEEWNKQCKFSTNDPWDSPTSEQVGEESGVIWDFDSRKLPNLL